MDSDFEPLILLEDEPVPSHKVDELELAPFAKVIAGAAVGTEGPFTIGVFGGWGTGKSSVLKQAKSLIEERYPKAITVWFNAWRYEREPQPLIPLISNIVAAIEEKQSTTEIITQKSKDALRYTANALRALAYGVSSDVKIKLPGIADLGLKTSSKDIVQRLEKLEEGQIDALLQKTQFMSIFEHLEKLSNKKSTEEIRPKFVVFIDDLDRCYPNNGLRLLEAIKLVLAQRGFVFILAVDRPKIESYLRKRYKTDFGIEDYGHSGTSYFDKIVQLPLALPPHERRFEGYVRQLITRPAISNNPKVLNAFKPLVDILVLGAAANPRSLVRLINNLLVDWQLWCVLEKEADPKILRMSSVSRIIRQHLGEIHFSKLARDNELCETIANNGGADELQSKLTKSQAGELNIIDQDRVSILQQIELNENLRPIFKNKAVKGWLTDHKFRVKVENFLVTQREESVENAPPQHHIIELAIRQSLGKTKSESLSDSDRDQITELDFTRSKLNDAGLEHIGKCTNLQRLWLQSTNVTDVGLINLETLSELTELRLSGTRVTDNGLRHLAKLLNLQQLWLTRTRVSDAGLQKLTALNKLQILVLDNTRITDKGLAHIAKLGTLKQLWLAGTKVTNTGLAYIEEISELTNLGLEGTRITDSGLENIDKLKNLRVLVLDNTQVTDTGLVHLKELGKLRELGLERTAVTDAGLVHLEKLSLLREIWLTHTKVSEAGRERLQRTLPDCNITI